MNYKKVQVMATAHDLFITYDDLRFLDQSVVDLDEIKPPNNVYLLQPSKYKTFV